MTVTGPAPSLSLVIPAFNEEERLPRLLDALATSAHATVAGSGFSFLEALIVDDGSTDATPELLREAAAAHSFLRVLTGDNNRGKGAAIAAGVRAARGEYALLTDIDLSTPLDELGRLADAVYAGAHIAIGSRVVAGSVVKSAPAYRKLLGQGFNLTVRVLTGLTFGDTQCGFKLLATPVAKSLLAEQISRGWAYDVELLMRARLAGLEVVEVPVTYLHDSRSRMSVVSASMRMLLDVVAISLQLRTKGAGPLDRRDRSRHPPEG